MVLHPLFSIFNILQGICIVSPLLCHSTSPASSLHHPTWRFPAYCSFTSKQRISVVVCRVRVGFWMRALYPYTPEYSWNWNNSIENDRPNVNLLQQNNNRNESFQFWLMYSSTPHHHPMHVNRETWFWWLTMRYHVNMYGDDYSVYDFNGIVCQDNEWSWVRPYEDPLIIQTFANTQGKCFERLFAVV